MNATAVRHSHSRITTVAPFVLFAAYVSWLVVPTIVRKVVPIVLGEVVPEVVQAVIGGGSA